MLVHHNFVKKDDLANLKTEVHKLNLDKLEKLDDHKLSPVPTDLSKLSDIVKNKVVQKS